MFKKVMFALVVISLVGSAVPWADAATRTPGVKKRQHRQAHRIGQGVRSGELTRDEARGLVRHEREIRKMKRDAKSDGVVTPEERTDLHQKLNQESRKIYEEKHDAETR
ncbi:MAG: hypothetical protein ACYC5N_03430 [Endomicrobiales bacterium]